MSDELKRILAVLCYIAGAALLGYTAYTCLTTALLFRSIVLLAASTFVSLLFATLLRCRISKAHAQRRRLVRLFLVLCFGMYAFVLINLLFVHNSDASNTLSFFSLKDPNFVPFKSIIGYLGELINGSAEQRDILIHLLGNIALYMPLGFFLMTLFNGLNKGKYYFPTVLAIMVGIRALQYSLGFGRFDVDDILLNLLGAAFVFMIFDIQAVRRYLKKWYLGDRIRK